MNTIGDIMASKSVAVIGASWDSTKSGSQLLQVLQNVGFKGRITGVNPQEGEVFGVPLYRKIDDIPFDVDLAVLLIPPAAVPAALNDCVRKGVKGVVISSEGFAETGSQGAQYQEEIRKILKESGMRGIGPNTLGIVNTETKLTSSHFSNIQMLQPGSIGLIAQSGIFVGALLRYLSSFDGLRISKGLGLGNKVDIDESDALAYLMDDEQTKIIGMYLEDIRDGRRFMDVCRRAVARKPVLIVKGGRTQEGAATSASHTASLAVADTLFDGAMRQAGVLRMTGIDELIWTIRGFLTMPLPNGPSLAFVTYSGAQAIMSIDTAMEEGLTIARFGSASREQIGRVISMPSKLKNPIDFFPDMVAHGFEKTSIEILNALMDDDNVHGIVFISYANFGAEPYKEIVNLLKKKRTKPVFFSLLGSKEELQIIQAFMDENNFPCYDFPETAVRVFSRMWTYARSRGRKG
ncbi:MAG: Peptidyl-lysine N-acetyltransferase Pat [Syntrophus sp. SKADARSKE-3]|nr:Peptidyl-lysine N-acetyltransferase Pat [Syntrophus sp. SKADARSKE-3]